MWGQARLELALWKPSEGKELKLFVYCTVVTVLSLLVEADIMSVYSNYINSLYTVYLPCRVVQAEDPIHICIIQTSKLSN